jgi:phospholipid/cholesterol/gamma-HCH transport system ATP-binding protein
MIEFRNVWKSFRGGRDQILKGIDIDFEAGKLTYILGPSGAGKSVTLKHILGLLHPDKGTVKVLGKDLSKLSRDELKQHRLNFGMLFQNSALFDDMTIFENVAFPLWEHTDLDDDQVQKKVSDTLTILGMPSGHDKYPNELSGGMKKRVGLARAIIREPKILLYDEPTTGLDPVTRNTVDDLIETLKTRLKLTSLVISHDIPSALRLADQIVFLYQGQFIFVGPPSEFVKSEHEAIQSFLEAEKISASTVARSFALDRMSLEGGA